MTRCYDCQRIYGNKYGFPDLVVQDDIWHKICPPNGLLCPSCICQRLDELQISCEAFFTSGPFAPTLYRHKKRGSLYSLIGVAEVQTFTPISDRDQLIIYRGYNEPRKLWARPRDEFTDGRFEIVSS
jgi:hypothetical protein